MTLKQTLDEFISSRIMSGLVEKSVKDYREFCTRFIAFVGSFREYETLSQEDISNYILSMMQRPISKTTAATYIRHTKVYLKWCSETYASTGFDYRKIKVPKSPKRHVLIYGDDEIKALFEGVEAENDWLIYRNRAILALMLDSGCRQAEITRIICVDVDYKRCTVNIHGKGEKDRVVPLGNTSARYIREYIAACPKKIAVKDNLFITRELQPITTNTVKLMVSKLSRKLPFEISSHKLRHNFATNYCLNQYRAYGQIDIYQLMYLLGHEDVETTSRYLHFAYELIATEHSISHVDKVFSAT